MIMEKQRFLLSLSALNVEVACKSRVVRDFCREFLSSDLQSVDFSAETSDKDVAEEMRRYNAPHGEDYCESVCIYREIAERLPTYQRAVFHGAAIEVCGKGYIFTAPSGVGKSTHVRLWTELLGERARVINGDKPIISVDGKRARVWGSPWSGKERWGSNCSADLEAICILKRGDQNKIREVDPREYFDTLMGQMYFPKDGCAVLKTLEIAEELSKKVKFYLLECDISEEAARLSFETMTGLKIK